MRWRALGLSLALHGIVALALATLEPRTAPSRGASAPVAIELLPAQPRPSGEQPSRGEPLGTAKPATTPSRVSAVGAHSSALVKEAKEPSPSAVSPPAGPWMRMRASGGAATLPIPDDASHEAALHALGANSERSPLELPPPRRPAREASELIPSGQGTFRTEKPAFVARVEADGTVRLSDMPTFDLTDALMRWHGDDPYRYEKAAFLDRTRERRTAMASTAREERFRAALHRLPRFLASVWSDRRLPARDRRRILFELWDECAEREDAGLALAGKEARATIVDFVRRQLPATGPDAYSATELGSLNARRRSAERFAPYDGP